MLKEFLYTFIMTIMILLAYSCTQTNEPKKPIEPINITPYMTLKIGDIRQFHIPEDSFLLHWEVIDTVKRKDGLNVFHIHSEYFLPTNFYADEYYFIRNGFFINTELDTVKEPYLNHSNPFREHRVAKIIPENGEIFQRTLGVPDSDLVFLKTTLKDSLVSNTLKFEDVFEYEFIDDRRPIRLKTYYCKNYGFVGSHLYDSLGGSKIFATYLKIDTMEVGERITIGNQLPNIYKENNRLKNENINIILGKN